MPLCLSMVKSSPASIFAPTQLQRLINHNHQSLLQAARRTGCSSSAGISDRSQVLPRRSTRSRKIVPLPGRTALRMVPYEATCALWRHSRNKLLFPAIPSRPSFRHGADALAGGLRHCSASAPVPVIQTRRLRHFRKDPLPREALTAKMRIRRRAPMSRMPGV